MIRRKKTDSDGKCCMEILSECTCLREPHEWCETYLCPFYKPDECGDWIRKDNGIDVMLFTPEEYFKEGRL